LDWSARWAIGTEETWKNLVAGQSGVGTITQFDTTGFDCKIAGEIKNFDPFLWIEKKELKKMGRLSRWRWPPRILL